jgi:hypothetical protein
MDMFVNIFSRQPMTVYFLLNINRLTSRRQALVAEEASGGGRGPEQRKKRPAQLDLLSERSPPNDERVPELRV